MTSSNDRAPDNDWSIALAQSSASRKAEAAFNRAFKREFGAPPGQFRRQFKGQSRRLRARSGVVASETATPIKKSGIRF
jgi:hypothetical protein